VTVLIIEAYHCCQFHTKLYPTFFSLGYFHMQMKLLGITSADFDVIGQMADQILYIHQILEKKKWQYNGTVHQIYDFKKVYDSVRRQELCSILIEFGIPKKLVGESAHRGLPEM
jgi:hypothetical protein